MGATGICFTMITPILVGSVVDGLGFSREMVGYISSVNIFGLAFGAAVASVTIGKTSLLTLIRLACIGLISCELLSCFVSQAPALLAIRALSGVFGGALYAYALASFSVLSDSRKAFGYYIICYAVMSLVFLFVLPFLIEAFDYRINFFFLFLISVVSLLLSGVVSKFENRIQKRSFDRITRILANKNIILSLSAYYLLQLGGGLMYIYSERIGIEAGLSIRSIGVMLSLSSIFAILGAFLVIRISKKYKVVPQIIINGFLMMLSMVCLFYSEYLAMFFLGLSLISIAWSYLIPFHQQNQASFDELGRIVSVGSIVNMMGRATGPAMAALLLGDAAFENVLWIAILAVAISTILFSMLLSRNQSG